MPTTVYLVRHGEVFNPDQIIYGRLPGFLLSETGRKQAHALGSHLSAKKLAAIYASPLDRTRETASHIQKHHGHLSVTHDERLIEVHSPLEGKPIATIEPDNWNFYQEKYFRLGQETLGGIWNRMNAFIREKVRTHAGQEIAVVSHGDPIMISKAQFAGLPLSVASIRSGEYVQTAKGYEIVFEDAAVIAVRKLEF